MTRLDHYIEWIHKQGWADPEKALGECSAAVTAMLTAFPTLRKAVGFIRYESLGYANGKQATHWWCVDTETGQIVDPTASQYCMVNVIDYEEVNESEIKSEPRRCPNCGDMFFGDDYLCTDTCAVEYMAYVTGG